MKSIFYQLLIQFDADELECLWVAQEVALDDKYMKLVCLFVINDKTEVFLLVVLVLTQFYYVYSRQ